MSFSVRLWQFNPVPKIVNCPHRKNGRDSFDLALSIGSLDHLGNNSCQIIIHWRKAGLIKEE